MIEENSVVSPLTIGSGVHIGKQCVIGERCILKDNCKILDGSVLEPDTVVPSFTVFGGKPAVFQGLLTESFQEMMKTLTLNYYTKFVGIKSNKKKYAANDGSQSH